MSEQSTQRPRLSRNVVFESGYTPLTIRRHVQWPISAHSHDFVEVVFVACGAGIHRTVTGDRTMTTGDVFVLRPGSWHAYLDCNDLEIYNCCFGTELLQRELSWVLDDPIVGSLFGTMPSTSEGGGIVSLHLESDEMQTCIEHLEAARNLEDGDSLGTKPDRIGHLLLLIGVLSRSARSTRPLGVDARVNPKVLGAMRLLRHDLRREWTLDELAGELVLDRSYLSRIFKAGVGLPPLSFLNKARAERAAYLLLHTDSSVSSIGSEVGWCDPNYFARRFRAHYGVSPTVYRESVLSVHTAGHQLDITSEPAQLGRSRRSR